MNESDSLSRCLLLPAPATHSVVHPLPGRQERRRRRKTLFLGYQGTCLSVTNSSYDKKPAFVPSSQFARQENFPSRFFQLLLRFSFLSPLIPVSKTPLSSLVDPVKTQYRHHGHAICRFPFSLYLIFAVPTINGTLASNSSREAGRGSWSSGARVGRVSYSN